MIACPMRLSVIVVVIGITFRGGSVSGGGVGIASLPRHEKSEYKPPILSRDMKPEGRISPVVGSVTCPFYDMIYPRGNGRATHTKLRRKLDAWEPTPGTNEANLRPGNLRPVLLRGSFPRRSTSNKAHVEIPIVGARQGKELI